MYLNPNGSTGFNESIGQAGRVSHMLGAYSGPEIDPVLNSLYKMRYSTPDKLKPMINQLAYYSELYSTMMRPKGARGITQNQRQEILDTAVLGDLTIGAGKWGNAYRTLGVNLLRPTKTQYRAQVGLGLRDSHGLSSAIADVNHNLDPVKLLRFLGHSGELRAGTDQATRIFSAFNQSAATIASVAGTNKAMRLFDQVKTSQRNMPNMATAQAMAMDTLTNQTLRVTTGFSDLANMLGAPLLKPLKGFMKRLADTEYGAANYLQQHPAVAGAASAGLIGGSVLGVVKLAQMVGGAGAFVHAAAHSARHSTGVGGWLRFGRHGIERGAGTAEDGIEAIAKKPSLISRFMPNILDTLTLGSSRRALGRVPFVNNLGGAVGRFGSNAMADLKLGRPLITQMLEGTIGKAVGALAKFGLRVIPVVGEVIMLMQAVTFLGSHSKEIGKVLGTVARWIVRSGAPLVMKGFGILFDAIFKGTIDLAGTVLKGILATFQGHGFIDWIKDIATNATAAYNGDPKPSDGTKAKNGVIGGRTANPSRGSAPSAPHHVVIQNVNLKVDPKASPEHHARELLREVRKTGSEATSGSTSRGSVTSPRIGMHRAVNAQ